MTDAIIVTDAFEVGDASVQVDASHRRVGALQASAGPARRRHTVAAAIAPS